MQKALLFSIIVTDMFRINAYNIKRNEKRLAAVLVLFVIFIMLSIYFSSTNPPKFNPNYLFVPTWIYLLVTNMRLKKIAHSEELKQLRRGMVSKDKREYPRYPVSKDENIRANFSVIKYLWLFETKKKRLAKILDISEGGVQLQTDIKDINEGEKATAINITFPERGGVTADGLIVRVTSDRCAIKFINVPKKTKVVIQDYILYKE